MSHILSLIAMSYELWIIFDKFFIYLIETINKQDQVDRSKILLI